MLVKRSGLFEDDTLGIVFEFTIADPIGNDAKG